MRPTKETLDEFIRLYEADFQETLTEDEALEMWVRVMGLYLLLYREQDGHAAKARPGAQKKSPQNEGT